jgi:hypothetical protein
LYESVDEWEQPSQEWTNEWNRTQSDRERQDSERQLQALGVEAAQAVRRQRGNNRIRHDQQVPDDDQCGICFEPYTRNNNPPTYNDVCKHRLCEVCCLTWMHTPLFLAATRDDFAERIVKSGTCPTCKSKEGTWRRVLDERAVAGRGGVVIGHWERNQLRHRNSVQIKEVPIVNHELWNSLAIYYHRDHFRVTPIAAISTRQHHSVLLRFFISQEAAPGARGMFTCFRCERSVELSYICKRDTCELTCAFKSMCFDCAREYTTAILEGAVKEGSRDGELVIRRELVLGGSNCNRDHEWVVRIGQVRFKCETCRQRGKYRRLDGNELDCSYGFCSEAAIALRGG